LDEIYGPGAHGIVNSLDVKLEAAQSVVNQQFGGRLTWTNIKN
jgi:hypothetical protein